MGVTGSCHCMQMTGRSAGQNRLSLQEVTKITYITDVGVLIRRAAVLDSVYLQHMSNLTISLRPGCRPCLRQNGFDEI